MINKESAAIFFAGMVQGIVLVAFPAAGTIFTDPHGFNFSAIEYGSLFIPQCILAICASALNPRLSRKFGSKSVFVTGLGANLISMILLALSALLMNSPHLSYVMLLFATGCLGIGFGLVVPTVNAMTALLNPTNVDSTLLVLNALLGIGTALAPILISIFVLLGFWWELPLFLSLLLVILLLFSIPLALPGGKITISLENQRQENMPKRFFIFAAFAFLYGIIETLNGNWIPIYMDRYLHATLEEQSIALTAFWGMLTFGRVFFAAIHKIVKEQTIFQLSPFISAAALILVFLLPSSAKYWAIAAFGLAGFGCSVLLPLIIGFGNAQLRDMASSIPGMLISFYLLGYGIAAFGVGPLEEAIHISLSSVYALGAVIAIILGIIALFIIRPMKNRS